MTTYALLIYRLSPPSVAIPERVEQRALAGHLALQAEAAGAENLLAVARLDEPASGRTVTLRATGHEVTDGPFIESKEWLIGFYLVDCADEGQAVARARQICTDEQHAIEVRKVGWRWRP